MSQYRFGSYRFRLCRLFNDSGGDEEIRTLDPLLAGQVLSQLSYTPRGFSFVFFTDSENRTTNDFYTYSTLLTACCE